jgi:hypothetical protein
MEALGLLRQQSSCQVGIVLLYGKCALERIVGALLRFHVKRELDGPLEEMKRFPTVTKTRLRHQNSHSWKNLFSCVS